MGVIAVFLVNTLLQKKVEERGEVRAVATRPVVVAAVDMDVGRRLDSLAVKTVDWPAESIPEGSFGSVEGLLGKQPPVVLKEVRKGEPLLAYKVSPHGARGGLTARIPSDHRAITIAVNEVRGVAGFVLPGDRVDILLTQSGREGASARTRTLLENVLVLGVDQASSERENEPKVVNAVTVLVSPRDGQRLTLAQSIGDLTLLLRNDTDVGTTAARDVTMADLSYAAPPPKAQKQAKTVTRKVAPARASVEVIRGLSVSQQNIGQ
jgi:pilus assembly protein CpaB